MEINLKITPEELTYLIIGFPCPHPDYLRSVYKEEVVPHYVAELIDTKCPAMMQPCAKWDRDKVEAQNSVMLAKVFYFLRDYVKEYDGWRRRDDKSNN